MLIKEKKYELLLSAQLGAHHIDCLPLAAIKEEDLDQWEVALIKQYAPMLNIQHNHKIDNVTIEKLLNNLRHQTLRMYDTTFTFDFEDMELIPIHNDEILKDNEKMNEVFLKITGIE